MDALNSSGSGLSVLKTLFESNEPGVELAVKELSRYRKFNSVTRYIVRDLLSRGAAELEDFIFQLCNLIYQGVPVVQDLLAGKSGESLHFALYTLMHLRANVDDGLLDEDPIVVDMCHRAEQLCLSRVARADASLQTGSVAVSDERRRSLDDLLSLDATLRKTSIQTGTQTTSPSKSKKTLALRSYRRALMQNGSHQDLPSWEATQAGKPATGNETKNPTGDLQSQGELRRLYLKDSMQFLDELVGASRLLKSLPRDRRSKTLTKMLRRVNVLLLSRMIHGSMSTEINTKQPVIELTYRECLQSVHLALFSGAAKPLRVLRVDPNEIRLLHSRERAPFLICVQVLESTLPSSNDPNLYREGECVDDAASKIVVSFEPDDMVAEDLFDEDTLDEAGREESASGAPNPAATSDTPEEPPATAEDGTGTEKISGERLRSLVFGESWEKYKERISQSSPFSSLPGYTMVPMIVKAGDDLRQELFAMQFITMFKDIFIQEGLASLGITDYRIVCISSDGGLVEVVPECSSIHNLKSKTPGYVNLYDFFERLYGPADSASYLDAQRNFTESLVGYSLICYFGSISDRHNANIMLNSSGGLVHIDFGYMLANAPGAIKFEQAPFKFTTEYLELLGGRDGSGYERFVELFVAGFFAARKHAAKIISLVEMLEGSNLPCMGDGDDQVVEALEGRFFLDYTDEECESAVLRLIEDSCQNWTTVQYDHYQYITNGYL